MKATVAILALLLWLKQFGLAQGFVNLNFESANVVGHVQGDFLQTNSALPGWNADYITAGIGTYPAGLIVYGGLSTGSAFISITDTNCLLLPINGRYSLVLFASGGNYSTDTSISQTGLIPTGTRTLLLNAAYLGSSTITVGGQVINMIPLQTFANYTQYGGDISAFAGQTATLNITQLHPPYPGQVTWAVFDNIQFSASTVPEPNSFVLVTLASLFLACRRRLNS